MSENITSKHKIVKDGNGYRFIFYCDVSEAHVCTTQKIYQGNTKMDALLTAWHTEGRKQFNKCHKCGKWVIDAMFNAEVLECVECAPYEAEPKYCKNCGTKIEAASKICPSCGKKLIYEGV